MPLLRYRAGYPRPVALTTQDAIDSALAILSRPPQTSSPGDLFKKCYEGIEDKIMFAFLDERGIFNSGNAVGMIFLDDISNRDMTGATLIDRAVTDGNTGFAFNWTYVDASNTPTGKTDDFCNTIIKRNAPFALNYLARNAGANLIIGNQFDGSVESYTLSGGTDWRTNNPAFVQFLVEFLSRPGAGTRQIFE